MNNSYPKAFLAAVCLTGIFFSALIFLFNALQILSFDTSNFGNPLVAGVPLYAIAATFAVPSSGLFTYLFLNSRFPNNALEKFSLSLSNLLLGICVAMLFFGYLKWYTLSTFFMLFILLLYVEYRNKLRFMYRFYRSYATLLIPFYLTCLFLKQASILTFNKNATLKLNLFDVPIEAYFYLMNALLTCVYLFELFKSKSAKTNG